MEIAEPPNEPSNARISFAKWLHLLVSSTTILLLIALVAVAIRLASALHHTLLLFALGALIAYALDPLVEFLRHIRLFKRPGQQRTPSRGATVAMLFFVLIAALSLALIWLGHQLQGQILSFETDYPNYQHRALALCSRADRLLAKRHVTFRIVSTIHHPPFEIRQAIARAGGEVIPALTHFVSNIGESVIVLLISVYLLLFAADMKEKLNGALPENLRDHVHLWETDINRILGGFVRGQVIFAILMGALTGIACLFVGIHLWLIIGVFVAITALIPVFGPYLGAIPAIIAAIVGPTHFASPVMAAVVIVIALIVINEFGSKILYPRLVGAALGIHEVVVLFVLFAGLEIGGLFGVLFAAPITALAIVTVVHLYRYWQDLPDEILSASLNKGNL